MSESTGDFPKNNSNKPCWDEYLHIKQLINKIISHIGAVVLKQDYSKWGLRTPGGSPVDDSGLATSGVEEWK